MKERFTVFTVLITKISRSIRRIKTEEMDDLNLKSPHVSCLYYLYKMGELTAKELCDICCEDKSAISRSIEYLEDNNYIVCKSDMKKRYNSPFVLSEKGFSVGARLAEKVDNILDKASEGIREEDRVVMYNSLNAICNNLEKICKGYEGE